VSNNSRPQGDVDETVLRSTEEFYGSNGVPDAVVKPMQEQPTRRIAAPVAAASPLQQPERRPSGAHRTRKARLRLSHVDPWSMMKTSFVFSVAFGIATVVLVLLTWGVLATSGVFDMINQMVSSVLLSPGDDQQFRIQDFFGLSKVVGLTILLSVLNVVILTALSTLLAFLYNTSARLIGGLDVTLAED